jgi:hypothetical protein
MNRFTKFAAAAGAAAMSTTMVLAPAQADTTTWQCQDGGHYLTTTIHYTTGTTNHTWQYLTYQLTGSGTGGKSNWSASFNDGTGARNYVADNDDDLDQNVLYTENFTDYGSPRSRAEKWTASAAFDTAGTDNHCTSSVTL